VTGPGWTQAVTVGLAEYIATAGLAVWDPSNPYPDGSTGLFYRWLPPGPDRAMVLTPYAVADDPDLTDVELGVQVRTRGAAGETTAPDDLADQLYDLLHGARRVQLGPADAVLISRQSFATFGPDRAGADSADRWERVDNYRIRTARATPNLTD
jgi:minor capsid protein